MQLSRPQYSILAPVTKIGTGPLGINFEIGIFTLPPANKFLNYIIPEFSGKVIIFIFFTLFDATLFLRLISLFVEP